MLHTFCICSISSIIGPLFSFLFLKPPPLTHPHPHPPAYYLCDHYHRIPPNFPKSWTKNVTFLNLSGLGKGHFSSPKLSKNCTDHVKAAYHSWEIPHTSHGAGQTRPVNSGKLLVWCRLSRASFHLFYRDKHTGFIVSHMTCAWRCWGRLKHTDDMVQTHMSTWSNYEANAVQVFVVGVFVWRLSFKR